MQIDKEDKTTNHEYTPSNWHVDIKKTEQLACEHGKRRKRDIYTLRIYGHQGGLQGGYVVAVWQLKVLQEEVQQEGSRKNYQRCRRRERRSSNMT